MSAHGGRFNLRSFDGSWLRIQGGVSEHCPCSECRAATLQSIGEHIGRELGERQVSESLPGLGQARGECPACTRKGVGFAPHAHAQGWKEYGKARCRYCRAVFTVIAGRVPR